ERGRSGVDERIAHRPTRPRVAVAGDDERHASLEQDADEARQSGVKDTLANEVE
ncbi:MAG: hypothetical protein H0V74_01735, partial [Chloroflexi bacterium]|nr:hypothetical protein [Chloroflexota bacterium]